MYPHAPCGSLTRGGNWPQVDVLVVVENQKLLEILPPGMPLQETLHAADEVARHAIIGLAGILSESQLVNVDFADVRSVVEGAGMGWVTIGRADGAPGGGRAEAAANAALTSPLLDVELERVKAMTYLVKGGPSMTLHEVSAVGKRVAEVLDPDAQLIFGGALPERPRCMRVPARGTRPGASAPLPSARARRAARSPQPAPA